MVSRPSGFQKLLDTDEQNLMLVKNLESGVKNSELGQNLINQQILNLLSRPIQVFVSLSWSSSSVVTSCIAPNRHDKVELTLKYLTVFLFNECIVEKALDLKVDLENA